MCQSLFFNKVAGLRSANLFKETLPQVFPFEFYEIFKNIFFTEHLWTTASEGQNNYYTHKQAWTLVRNIFR